MIKYLQKLLWWEEKGKANSPTFRPDKWIQDSVLVWVPLRIRCGSQHLGPDSHRREAENLPGEIR